jgi:multimeric flavodoxin WrbA
MKILVINGSPKGNDSSTLKLTRSFLEGMNSVEKQDVEFIDLLKSNISPCTGCFGCWTKTPGTCVLKDDMADYIPKVLAADLLIWSFPLYYFGMPSKTKLFLDRMLPTSLPFMVERDAGGSSHPHRYNLEHQKHMLISTCGFYSTQNNYDALYKQFEILYEGHYDKIICTEGELFKVPQLSKRTNQYLSFVKQAGIDYASLGKISEESKNHLEELLYPAKEFIQMADASWKITESNENPNTKKTALNFMRQMGATFNKDAVNPSEHFVIEMKYTDLDESYQFVIQEGQCTLLTQDFKPNSVLIETTYDVWMQISEGKLNGAQAMMDKLYKVTGSFETMMKMNTLFGSNDEPVQAPKEQVKAKKSVMLMLLVPWISLWILLPLQPKIAGLIAISICALLPLLSGKVKQVIYEKLGYVLVCLLGLGALMGVDTTLLVLLSYFLFGALWLGSTFTKVPLTAHYSSASFNGEEAYKNPLFIKTNRILTMMWGILYILSSVLSYFLMNSFLAEYTGLINYAIPSGMGLFTAWFAKWYPAKVARG